MLPALDRPAGPPSAGRLRVLGVPIDAVGPACALAAAERLVRAGRPAQIVTANALMVLAAGAHPGLREAFESADLVVPDSAGIVWAARRGGFRGAAVPGIDLMDALCGRAASAGWSVFLLGAAPGVAEQAAAALAARHPGLRLAGTAHGRFAPGDEPALIARVAAARPDLLFVALDTPRQDAWIHRHLARFGAVVAMGVGGSFDVFSGRLPRAPRWMRRAGLEWLFRLLREPSRARRMSGLPLFVWRVLRDVPRRVP